MIHTLLVALAANAFAIPRVDFDLHPGAMAFIIFCIALVGGLVAAVVVLSVTTERESSEAQTPSNSAASDASDEVAPFIPDEATPNLAVAEKELTSIGSWAEDPAKADEGLENRQNRESRSTSDDSTSVRTTDRVEQ